MGHSLASLSERVCHSILILPILPHLRSTGAQNQGGGGGVRGPRHLLSFNLMQGSQPELMESFSEASRTPHIVYGIRQRFLSRQKTCIFSTRFFKSSFYNFSKSIRPFPIMSQMVKLRPRKDDQLKRSCC